MQEILIYKNSESCCIHPDVANDAVQRHHRTSLLVERLTFQTLHKLAVTLLRINPTAYAIV